ncbi:methylase involved in ubiquinone/menaquinone biosynthesis [Moorena producens 3L]|uniref:Methylase involved in ubiquinone/menaquinone biosynthesis n=1 Tax=Moorena producens 3L TaxID=489825 RepID=F4Y3Q0_9CYAN|nr:methylase involved in ubiquinone/menaquinone biosynthesis [Moorena producens 3L]
MVEIRDGTAQQTNLPDASIDLVACFQSFHWFDPEPTLLEFRRILKPTGQLAVVWNDRNRQDDFTKKIGFKAPSL